MKLPAWFYMGQWIVISCLMIIMNKAILSSWKFSYPFFLTSWHMLLATIITQILARTTNMLPSVNENKISVTAFRDKIVPIALFFALSLTLGNQAFLYLSVGYVQVSARLADQY